MTKGPILQDIWEQLPNERKARIQARADELEAQYLTLQTLRKTAGLTQARLSEALNMPQPNVSRLEKSSDMLLSTLRSYVEAVGGKLNLTVELPDHPPISLVGLGDLLSPPSSQAEKSPKCAGPISAMVSKLEKSPLERRTET